MCVIWISLLFLDVPATDLTAVGKLTSVVGELDSFQTKVGPVIELNCIGEGLPKPVILWYRNGVNVTVNLASNITSTETATPYKVTVNERLTVGQILVGDNNDIYECRATNIIGESTDRMRMLVCKWRKFSLFWWNLCRGKVECRIFDIIENLRWIWVCMGCVVNKTLFLIKLLTETSH